MTAVATGQYFSCAVLSTGAVRCWGENHSGQLGDGTTVNRLTPVDIAGSFYRPECPTIVAPTHTGFGLSDGYAIGSSATFAPDPGYVLAGTAVATCQADQTWSSAPPTAVIPATPPTVLPGSASVREGDSSTTALLVPVALSAASAVPVTVQWDTLFAAGAPGSQADPATDYSPTSGAVTFAPGETSKTVTVQVDGDPLVEPDEYVVVSFHDPTNALMGGFWGLGFGIITNDDHAVVLPGVDRVLEGDSGTARLEVPVTLSDPSSQMVTVQWNTVFVPGAQGDQADPANDYLAASGTVTFAPGETTKTVTVMINGDTLLEPDEVLVVSFHDPTNAAMGGFWGLGFGVISDDD